MCVWWCLGRNNNNNNLNNNNKRGRLERARAAQKLSARAQSGVEAELAQLRGQHASEVKQRELVERTHEHLRQKHADTAKVF